MKRKKIKKKLRRTDRQIIIIMPLFITFGDKNYGNISIKIQNTTYYIYISNYS